MELQIKHETTIQDLNEQFSKTFPFLKLEFFHLPHGVEEVSKDKRLDHQLTLGDVKPGLREGSIRLDPTETVGSFEQQVRKQFGLSVQIFRRSGKLWVETTKTDNKSLKQQNTMGQEASGSFSFNPFTLFL